ncbi:MAG: radical SAM protein [Spirochaetes bacterium]|nr:radical SAM protein [Spirochaetota bacterium]
MKRLVIDSLLSGGVITNYHCTSRCAHCLYRCAPERERAYMGRGTALAVFAAVRRGGCDSVHIGGGEPLLDLGSLEAVLDAAAETGVGIDYLETNASWFGDPGEAADLLARLMDRGVRTLLVSISPFHNEHIPFARVKGLLRACEAAGMGVFPWVADFHGDLERFDDNTPHRLGEYALAMGEEYIREIPRRYWLHPGGRAIDFLEGIFGRVETRELLRLSAGCRELADTTHFHFDLYGNYIPGLCSGLSIAAGDIGAPLEEDRYPLITSLYREGVRGVCDAARRHGFEPAPGYLNKCHLCNEARRFLAVAAGMESHELMPAGYYTTR